MVILILTMISTNLETKRTGVQLVINIYEAGILAGSNAHAVGGIVRISV